MIILSCVARALRFIERDGNLTSSPVLMHAPGYLVTYPPTSAFVNIAFISSASTQVKIF